MARTGQTALGAHLRIFVLACVQQVEGCQLTPAQLAVEADFGSCSQPLQRLRQYRSPQRHVLVKSLVARCPARGEVRHLRPAVARRLAGVVVLHLMVVPSHHPRTSGVHGLQIKVRLVRGIATAVVIERCDPSTGWHAHGLSGIGVFVDVVAQKHHHVGVVSAHVAVSAVVAMLPALARRIRQAKTLRRRISVRHSARAPD